MPKQLWQSSEQGQCSDPQPQGFGSMASWPASFPAPCMSSTALDFPPRCPQWWPWHEECPAGFGTAVLCPRSLLPASFCAVCGAGLSPSRLHRRLSASPGSSGRCAGSSSWLRPCCSSGLALGLILLSVCQAHPHCAGHASLAFPMSQSCAMSCVSPLCASVCPVSLQHVPAACPVSP